MSSVCILSECDQVARSASIPHYSTHKSCRYVTIDSPGVRGTRGLPFIREILNSRRRRSSSVSKPQVAKTMSTSEVSTEYLPSPHDNEEGEEGGGEITGSRADLRECIKSGQLSKTSRGRSEGSKPGPSRVRRFRLTEEALEYFQQFSHVSPPPPPLLCI